MVLHQAALGELAVVTHTAEQLRAASDVAI
jgi:hypothetical protein